jgi:hypothetical protein
MRRRVLSIVLRFEDKQVVRRDTLEVPPREMNGLNGDRH